MIAVLKKAAGLLGGIFTSPTMLLVIAVAIALLGQHLRIGGLKSDLQLAQSSQALLQANRDAWQASSEQLAMLLVVQVEERQRAQDAAAALAEQLQQDDEAVYTPLRQAIHAAPESDDGPVAPVLARAIGALP